MLRLVEDILSICCNKKCFTLDAIGVRQFLIMSKLPVCHDQKQHNVVSSVHNAVKLSRFASN